MTGEDALFDLGPTGSAAGGRPPGPVAPGHGAPLAARLRPRSLADYVGHAEALAPVVAMLRRGELGSLILWGPPGTGKTSLATVIAGEVDRVWTELSAVTAGVKDVRAVIAEARDRLDANGRGTVLFIDEIHRFNKGQQDALLPAVENGWVTLIGATTENPFFELNAPLLSRCKLVRLQALTDDDVSTIVDSALADGDRGFAGAVTLEDEARAHLVAIADGDARAALNALEMAVSIAQDRSASSAAPLLDTTGGREPATVTLDDVASAAQRFRYDRAGDNHYDQVSAFIKSLRGSDPDAAVYWLLRMLEAGEDPRFLARRMVIFASEDVGLADRGALPLAVAAFDALDKVGLPEATFALTHAAIGLATAPKSNAVTRAMAAGRALVKRAGNAPVPPHLRDAHYKSADRLGHGRGYDYPHDHPGGFVPQQYLPDELEGERLYRPTRHGHEAAVADRVEELRRQSDEARRSRGGTDDQDSDRGAGT
ncbi:MAG: replication-associated recombination protein A [Actinobacteria bacterium]|nr:replication-associated recombination protein A [Actinomycetota bacterium]